MLYCEIAYPTVSNRNIIIPEENLLAFRKPGEELYRSLYSYDAEILEHMKTRSTIRSYTGKKYLNRIIFDLDKGTDTFPTLQERTNGIIQRLIDEFNVPAGAISLYFSGTGFHIACPDFFSFTPDRDLPRTVAATILKHFGGSVDNIYSNATRLVRVTGTLNRKSLLYKIQLRLNDLIQLDENDIKRLASENKGFRQAPYTDKLPIIHPDKIVDVPVPVQRNFSLSPRHDSGATGFVNCMQRVYLQGEKRGERHNAILHMASSFRRGGLPVEATTLLMQNWASSLEPYDVQKVVQDVYEKQFRYSCHDPFMSSYCDPACIYYRSKSYGAFNASPVSEVEGRFVSYLQSGLINESFNLRDYYTMPTDYGFYPGEVAIILGDTGVGKSAWVQNLAAKVVHMKVLYITLEMSEELSYRRFVQIRHGLTKEYVYEHYLSGNNTYSEALRHIHIAASSPRLEAVGRAIAESGCNLVIIDTLDGIPTNGDDLNQSIGEVVIELKRVAMDRKVIILGVHHISKYAALSDTGLTLHSGKGSSSVEQKADKVIGITELFNDRRRVFALKSRDEAKFNLLYRFDPSTFRYTQIVEGK